MIREFFQEVKQQDLSTYAASMAFFLFLSLIPMLIFFCALLPFSPVSETDLTGLLQALVPDNMDSLIEGLVEQVYKKTAAILPFAFLTAVYSAGKGMLALMGALNRINQQKEERGYFHLRILASIYTVVFLICLWFSLLLGMFGRWLFTGRESLEKILWLRYPFVFLILTLLFSFLYTFIPSKKQTIVSQFPGALIAALGWNLYSFGFSWYINHFSNLTAYGSLGAVMLFLLWLYFFCYTLLIGADINLHFWKFFSIFIKY